MTVSYLSFSTPYSDHRDCVIVIQPRNSTYQAVCVDAATRLTIGCPIISPAPDGSRPVVSAADIIGMIGGYRLAATAVDIEADELAQRSRRLSDQLRRRRRLSKHRSARRGAR
jgi:hypothetical protein